MGTLSVGSTFAGEYQVEAVLGEGGFAVVYAATDAHGRHVALKVLKPTSAAARARFEREVAILRSLRDPHTVALIAAGTTPEGQPYLVFERVPGQDLSKLLATRGKLPADVVAYILRQVLAALREAHAAGLVHRDIKPENIRIFAQDADEFRAKLLDFGIARATDNGHPSVTATGELIGTPRYMSPEQLKNEPLTAASDVYSLGLVAVELLLGADALGGYSLAAQLKRLQSGHNFAVPLAGAPPELVNVIAKMTALQPEHRYPTAGAALGALERMSAAPQDIGRGAESPRLDGRGPHVTSPSRMVGAPAVLAAVALLIPLGGFVLWKVATPDEPTPGTASARRDAGALLRSDEIPPATPLGGPATNGGGRSDACTRDPAIFTERFDGVVRLPGDYATRTSWPALIVLHPKLAEPRDFVMDGGLAQMAREHGLVLLAPRSPSAWDDEEASRRRIAALVGDATRELCVDPAAVYLFGQAEGADLAWELSCAPYLAGGASSGYLPAPSKRFCDDARPRPFMLFLPTGSKHAPFDGGTSCTGKPKISAAEAERRWRNRNECRGEAMAQPHPHGVCFAWSCAAPLRSCHVQGGRDWPGTTTAPDFLGCNEPTSKFAAAQMLGEFLQAAEAARTE